uniref:hypothetical protein n=1 Tax=Agathobacter sp. TaxID=2021311 RepID=UPI0040571437
MPKFQPSTLNLKQQHFHWQNKHVKAVSTAVTYKNRMFLILYNIFLSTIPENAMPDAWLVLLAVHSVTFNKLVPFNYFERIETCFHNGRHHMLIVPMKPMQVQQMKNIHKDRREDGGQNKRQQHSEAAGQRYGQL